jgi:uncharacterized protein
MWKQGLLDWAERLEHPAWGRSHCQRVYQLSLELAVEQELIIEEEVLFAAAYLHDAGAFAPYKSEGVDHAVRSAEVAEEILLSLGFPGEKAPLVEEVIRGHMFYAEPALPTEAVVFHDADVLDFMGAIGIARLLSIVGLDDWTPDLGAAAGLIERFSRELPGKLHTPRAREIGIARQQEMRVFLQILSQETHGLTVL